MEKYWEAVYIILPTKLNFSHSLHAFYTVSSDIDFKSTLEQMEKQKKMLNKYETERVQFKGRIKELSDEMALLHGRELQGSGEDSPDQLSEIDKQQDLLAKISSKNKHIRRLLRDVEVGIR
jgi:predicted  nucleic acid-binding Zn-ribbon protein